MIILPATHKFDGESHWTWYRVSDLVDTLNRILRDRREKVRMTPQALITRFTALCDGELVCGLFQARRGLYAPMEDCRSVADFCRKKAFVPRQWGDAVIAALEARVIRVEVAPSGNGDRLGFKNEGSPIPYKAIIA